jgi:hypothetical protein
LVLCRRRRRRNCGSNMLRRWRARRKAIGHRLELMEGTSPRGLQPPRTSVELFFSCCDSVAALPALANCNGPVAKTFISRLNLLTPSALCTVPTARKVGVVKPRHSPDLDHANALPEFPVSRAKIPHGAPYVSPLLPPFFSRLLLHARLRTRKRASAATRWAPFLTTPERVARHSPMTVCGL